MRPSPPCSPPPARTSPTTSQKIYEHLRDNHLYVTYAIVPPQIDRSKPAHQQKDPTLYAGVVKERDDGIVISGAQQLATAGVFSDYLHLTCIHPLRPGDEAYANGVVIPIDTPGLKLYSRRTFATAGMNSFDYPLTSRFDEADCFCVFDNVFVPWESVYIYRNLQICWDQWWKTPAHLYGNHQAQCRYATKLRFMLGLAKRMNEMTGNEGHQAVQVEMGELAAIVSVVENMLLAHETVAPIDADGVLWPLQTALYCVMALQSELNGRMLETIRELAGAAMITLPSSVRDFDNPETARDIERYMQSATTSARDRVALMRMAWDFPRHRVRQPPRPIREVLRRRVVPDQAERQPLLRLQARHRPRRRGPRAAAGARRRVMQDRHSGARASIGEPGLLPLPLRGGRSGRGRGRQCSAL